MYITNF